MQTGALRQAVKAHSATALAAVRHCGLADVQPKPAHAGGRSPCRFVWVQGPVKLPLSSSSSPPRLALQMAPSASVLAKGLPAQLRQPGWAASSGGSAAPSGSTALPTAPQKCQCVRADPGQPALRRLGDRLSHLVCKVWHNPLRGCTALQISATERLRQFHPVQAGSLDLPLRLGTLRKLPPGRALWTPPHRTLTQTRTWSCCHERAAWLAPGAAPARRMT